MKDDNADTRQSAERQNLYYNNITMRATPIKDRPDYKQIEKELVQGTPVNQIAIKYDLKPASLYKYKQRHLSRKVNKARDKEDLKEGDKLLNLLETYIEQVNRVSQACLDHLQDPDDPRKLFLGSRAEDTTISYTAPDEDGVDRKQKATIQELLDRLNNVPTRVEIKGQDRVATLLAASQAMNKHIHLFAELIGKLSNVTINVTNQPVFIELTQVVMTALQDFPEARSQVGAYLRTLKLEDKTIKRPDRLL